MTQHKLQVKTMEAVKHPSKSLHCESSLAPIKLVLLCMELWGSITAQAVSCLLVNVNSEPIRKHCLYHSLPTGNAVSKLWQIFSWVNV
jgi:hypothetical protein